MHPLVKLRIPRSSPHSRQHLRHVRRGGGLAVGGRHARTVGVVLDRVVQVPSAPRSTWERQSFASLGMLSSAPAAHPWATSGQANYMCGHRRATVAAAIYSNQQPARW